MRYYIVTFDRKPDVSYKDFHADFVAHPRITRWFHYIKSSYIVGTTMTANELSDHFTATATAYGLPTTHLVLGVKLGDRQGILTKDAWKWIKKNDLKWDDNL
jgi:hypothetical protein